MRPATAALLAALEEARSATRRLRATQAELDAATDDSAGIVARATQAFVEYSAAVQRFSAARDAWQAAPGEDDWHTQQRLRAEADQADAGLQPL